MFLASILLALLAAAFARRAFHSKLISAALASLLLVSLLLTGLFLLADSISGAGIDDSVFFHLQVGLVGAGFSEFRAALFYALLYLSLSLAIAAVVLSTSKHDGSRAKGYIKGPLALTALTGSLATNPGIHDIINLVNALSLVDDSSRGRSVANIVYPSNFFSISNESLNLNKKNLVYIYLESVERTYLDEEIFPSLTPNLKAIEAESLSFTNIHQTVGSNWTIAGMVNSQCGLPLIVPGDQGNSMSGVGRFLPRANCIGDILHSHGYQLHYLGGSDKNFAGKASFYRSHGFRQVDGVRDFPKKIEPSRNIPSELLTNGLYRSAWGLYDDTLFEEIKSRFSKLSRESKPFALFALTLDTHHPNGHVSKYCSNITYREGDNSILNAIHCADKLVANLYEFITEHPAFANTVLVIASDHLAMPNSAQKLLERGNRKNLLLATGKQIAPGVLETMSSPVDIAPTVLNLLGADIKGLGFGRDLFSQDTLMSSYGNVGRYNHEILKHRQFLHQLWDFPQLDTGFSIALAQKTLLLAGDKLTYPALIMVGEELAVESIRFGFSTTKKLADHFSVESPEQRYIWIDFCSNLSAINDDQSSTKPCYCLAIGRLVDGEINKDRVNFYLLERNTTFTFDALAAIFNGLDGTM